MFKFKIRKCQMIWCLTDIERKSIIVPIFFPNKKIFLVISNW